jgi:hypothetical protein
MSSADQLHPEPPVVERIQVGMDRPIVQRNFSEIRSCRRVEGFASGNAEDGRSFGDQLIEYEVLANRVEDSAGNTQKMDWITVVKQDIIGSMNLPKTLKERRAVRQISCNIHEREGNYIRCQNGSCVSPRGSLSDRAAKYRSIRFCALNVPPIASMHIL